MLSVYKQFRPIIHFLLIFMATFFVFTIAYDVYLKQYEGRVDGMSSLVGHQSAALLRTLGFEAFASDMDVEKSTHVGIDGFARVKVIEGCNGLSVMILFVAFILGFAGRIKTKGWFIPAGLFLIHLFNLARVAILAWAVYTFGEKGYPIYKEMFTASIYVLVLVLWYIWVQKLSVVQTQKA